MSELRYNDDSFPDVIRKHPELDIQKAFFRSAFLTLFFPLPLWSHSIKKCPTLSKVFFTILKEPSTFAFFANGHSYTYESGDDDVAITSSCSIVKVTTGTLKRLMFEVICTTEGERTCVLLSE